MSDPERIRQHLIESGLMADEVVDAAMAEWRDAADAVESEDRPGFLDWLVDKGKLTEFQRDALAAGHSVPSLKVGPYRVYEMVIAGRLGGVFRAVHEDFDQAVSLKIFPPIVSEDSEEAARMGRELRVVSELQHPNIVRAYEIGHVGGTYYLAMEDLEGETLATRLERDGFLPFAEACRVARDVAKALQHLHENDVVHRDVRPENIWITTDGTVKLMEFGAARDAFADLDAEDLVQMTTHATTVGDLMYASPEQAQDAHNADAWSDLYSLGATLYDSLAGRPPFEEKNPVRLVVKLLCDEPQPLSDLNEEVPDGFNDTLLGLMAKQPQERFQKAKHAAMALDQYVPSEADEEEVVLVEVSSQYLEWVRSHQSQEAQPVSDGAVGVSPELTEFVEWMADISAQRQQRRGG